jgi:putative transposase
VRLEAIMRDVRTDSETELAESNGQSNHIHLFVNFPPKAALPKPVNPLKGAFSRRMQQELPDLHRHHWKANRLRSGSYFAGPAGDPISVLRHYTEQQDHPV